ncbi:MAG: hypothetical protein P1U61_02295 [Legionellaceae bacterium]|nr:hypothetical protein [Legionellaceae bacterium]
MALNFIKSFFPREYPNMAYILRPTPAKQAHENMSNMSNMRNALRKLRDLTNNTANNKASGNDHSNDDDSVKKIENN